MFGFLQNLFRRRASQGADDKSIKNIISHAASQMDLNDPEVRVGASLYLVLSKQFDLIGKPEGEFPYVVPFSSDKARGALLGTAIAVVRKEFGEIPNKVLLDAVVTAFSLAYGRKNGMRYAMQAFDDSKNGNADVNFASDWAIKDTDSANDKSSPASPSAFYLAVAELI